MTLKELRSELRLRNVDEHALRIVLEEVTGERYFEITRDPERALTNVEVTRAGEIVVALESGVPLQHAIGHWSFRGLELIVDRRALIPRPETELLVDIALRELARLREAGRTPLRCLDLGTGTGAIAISILCECPDVEVSATDVSEAALSLAAENAAAIALASRGRLSLCSGDWFEALDPIDSRADRFDVICSNPPYLSITEWDEVDRIVRDHDPRIALVAGSDGLDDIRVIAAEAPKHLADDGAVVVEIGWSQGGVATDIFTDAGAIAVGVLPDLAGRDRFILARF